MSYDIETVGFKTSKTFLSIDTKSMLSKSECTPDILSYLVDKMQRKESGALHDKHLLLTFDEWMEALTKEDREMLRSLFFSMYNKTFEQYSCGCLSRREKYAMLYRTLKEIYLEQLRFAAALKSIAGIDSVSKNVELIYKSI